MQVICEKEECCGCEACVNKCPKSAILMEVENGFQYPTISQELCIDCGLCQQVCPSLHKVEKNEEQENVYAVVNKKKEIRNSSSSGGVFYELAKKIILEQGIVYGAAYDENLQVKHLRIHTVSEISKLQGSKYVQSIIGDIYKEVERDLKQKRKVLFSGVPCQIGGLLSFLGKTYDGLITCEVLCHGNASNQVFQSHLKYKEAQLKDKIVDVNFRFKTENKPQNMKYRTKSKKEEILTDPMKDWFYYGFQSGVLLRENCFQCNYIGGKRCADITLADFWGLEKEAISKEDQLVYPSLVFINDEIGKCLFDAVQENFVIVERKMEEAKQGNLSLRRVMPKNKYRNQFFKEYNETNYQETASKYLVERKNWKDHIKSILGEHGTQKLIKILHR